MKEIIKYRISHKQDLPAIITLLSSASLPVTDVIENDIDFLVAITGHNEVIGCIGLESFENNGLLRSLAVHTGWRNKRIGHELLYRLISLSRQYGIDNLHLLTTTAEKFFSRAGFVVSGRDDAPETIRNTTEFSSLCPASSVYMSLSALQEQETICWSDIQLLQKDRESGSVYWAMKGKHLMLTSFEIPPHTTFDTHEHPGEQITYVLEGELYFEVETNMYRLSAGDSILIPGNKPHKVWTTETYTKAIDAWSPVNTKYVQSIHQKTI